jgi:hypothetical protein
MPLNQRSMIGGQEKMRSLFEYVGNILTLAKGAVHK